MRIDTHQLHTTLLLAKRVVKELIPRAFVKESFVDPFSFNLLLEIPVDMEPAIRDFLERRMNEVKDELSVKEMLESNARDYLMAHGFKKEAKALDGAGRRVISVFEYKGSVQIAEDECAADVGTILLLDFSEKSDGLWLLRGTVSHVKQDLQKKKKLYNQNKRREYRTRGEEQQYFKFSFTETKWLQDGIDAKKVVEKALRSLYSAVSIREVEGVATFDEYSLVPTEDTLFPESTCKGDTAITERVELQKDLLASVKDLLIDLGIPEGRISVDDETVSVQDVLGIKRITTKIQKKKGQKRPFLRIKIFRSIERIVALLLELANAA